ncbi:tRNA (guanosine(37)-N1)-methyltransferase TrmD [Alicyclobacillus tolerans]|uniref:tRNA (guanosine(37)-N1)-methyltransferase TrmD n=1 Tax=Alicyclobacillus tolerans TaxID=90970 RepID=UPI0027E1FE26|nr:tRNA (guanosine(37)-N1)-methyltransferase TrmD [Alicyclobacillus tolerans]MCF8564385.1 tRNA (guanosine(37)-N1)-methyltransferase TrmD [Alicyclobacillus tolerans]
MLDVTVLTLFPNMFEGVFGESIFKRAVENGAARVNLVNFREFATDRHKTVDDAPFGGGAGMLLKAPPLFDAMAAIPRETDPLSRERVVLLTPQGRRFTQQVAEDFSRQSRLVFICGHYEGVDERVRQELVTDEISIGDFVLTGGEIAAMAVLDAVVRLLPGVLGNEQSAPDDSFSSGLLEYPQYTRPAEYRGLSVPPVLLSGNHALIEEWRRKHALYRTWVRRPDMLEHVALSVREQVWVAAWEQGDFSGIDVVERRDI